MSPSKVVEAIANTCWNIREGVAQFEMMKISQSYLQTHVFSPQNVLCALDIAGGVCNLSAFQVIRNIETWVNDPLQNKKQTVLHFHTNGRSGKNLAN